MFHCLFHNLKWFIGSPILSSFPTPVAAASWGHSFWDARHPLGPVESVYWFCMWASSTYIWPHFSWAVDLCLWGHKKVFDGMTSFEVYFNPILLANILITFTQSLMVKGPQCKALELWCCLAQGCCCCLFSFLGLRTDSSTSFCFMAQSGYLHFLRDWYKCFSSLCNCPGFEQIVLALWKQGTYHIVFWCYGMVAIIYGTEIGTDVHTCPPLTNHSLLQI